MKSIILAAGKGERFNHSHPKCFMEVDGLAIIDKLIWQFHAVDIRDIYVVTRLGYPWGEWWWKLLGSRAVSIIMVDRTIYAFDSFRAAMGNMSSDLPTISILGDCLVDIAVIERLATNRSGILVIKYPPGEMRADDDFLGMSIPASELPDFMEACLHIGSMRHQDFFINHAQGLPVRMPPFATKPWVNVNRMEDVQKAEAFLKAQEEG